MNYKERNPNPQDFELGRGPGKTKMNKRHYGKIRKPVSQKELRYAELIVTGQAKSKVDAARKAGLTKVPTTATVSELIQKQRAVINKKFLDTAESMYENMKELALTAKNEGVRFSATKDLLDRAGFNPVSKSEDVSKRFVPLEGKLTKELVDRVNKLESQAQPITIQQEDKDGQEKPADSETEQRQDDDNSKED